jgi:hypothetical protein
MQVVISTPEYVYKLLIKQREEHMNTITIMSTVEGIPNVTYTEGEVLRYIEKAKGIDELNELLTKQSNTIRSIKNNVRDFFSEVEWEDGEQTVTKSDVNEFLESIGCNKLTSRYGGTFRITGTFQVEAEDADEAESIFVDNVDVSFNDGDYTIDETEVNDVEEDY